MTGEEVRQIEKLRLEESNNLVVAFLHSCPAVSSSLNMDACLARALACMSTRENDGFKASVGKQTDPKLSL